MYVKRIIEDNWSGVKTADVKYECSSVEQVVAAVRKLNGRNKTSIYLLADGEKSLTVSGGNDGRYIAFLTIGTDDEFYNLVALTHCKDQMMEVVTGGQKGMHPARQCIDLETVLEAAQRFALDGSMSPMLTWERQV